jgi:hypothetical protein
LKTPFLDANQGSLPVGGQPFPGGLVPAGSLQRLSVARFRLVLFCIVSFFCVVVGGFLLASAFPASQGFGWRQMIFDV